MNESVAAVPLSLRVLVVDDEPHIGRVFVSLLARHGHEATVVARGDEALEMLVPMDPDLVILDLGLPDMSGYEVLEAIRAVSTVPVVVVSARDRETDKICALDRGADDYLAKPFSTGELMARIRSVTRRTGVGDPMPVIAQVGGLRIDSGRRTVTVDGHDVKLTPKEFDLLRFMVANSGRVLSYRTIMRGAWGLESEDAQLLRVHMSNLRRKINEHPAAPRHILTEPGVGFRLVG